MSIGNTIQEHREKIGLTQKELADHAGVTEGAVKAWERGSRVPKLNALFRLASALGLLLTDLTNHANDPHRRRNEPGRPRKTPVAPTPKPRRKRKEN